jgi:hypothetical protein
LGDIELPQVGDTLQLLLTSIHEEKAAPGDQVLHGLRDDDLPRACFAEESGTDRDREPAGFTVDDLTLADMHPSPCLDAEVTDVLADLVRTVDRSCRP